MSNRSTEERFWAKVCKTETCWLWTAGKNQKGYGQFDRSKAHRFSYALHFGPIPEGLQVMHKCDVRHCVNPEHLELGTNKDNSQDCSVKGRKPRGEKHSQSKLTEAQVLEVRALYAKGGHTQFSLADKFSVHYKTIHMILAKKIWRHLL